MPIEQTFSGAQECDYSFAAAIVELERTRLVCLQCPREKSNRVFLCRANGMTSHREKHAEMKMMARARLVITTHSPWRNLSQNRPLFQSKAPPYCIWNAMSKFRHERLWNIIFFNIIFICEGRLWKRSARNIFNRFGGEKNCDHTGRYIHKNENFPTYMLNLI